ncbi:MAG: PepSY domain-containing protein [Sphingomonadales bacterium]|nr:PepSY domain-containing protein [Sphingomonadales bacterium]
MSGFRRGAAAIHLWLGLTFGLVGMYLAATGAWILFRPEMDAAVNPGYMTIAQGCTRPVSLDSILASATRAYPRSPVDSIRWTQGARASLMVRYHDDAQLYFNPCTAATLGFHGRWAGIFGFVEKLHRLRFLPTSTAAKIGGTTAAVMALVLGGVGLFLWWPRRRSAWVRSLRFDPGLKGRARVRNRHSVTGAFAVLGLLVVSGTGIALAFESVEALVFSATGTRPIAKPDTPSLSAGSTAALDAAWHNVLALSPEVPRAASLRLPTASRPSIEIYLYDQGNPNLEGRSYAYADANDGRIVSYTSYAATPLGQRLYSWLVALHEGEVGGLVGKVLTLATMLAILYLGWSGLKGYLLKRVSGAAPLRLRVVAVRNETPDVKAFELMAPDGRRLPRVVAGAHIEVLVPGGPRRQYSLCNGPSDRHAYHIAVKLDPASRGGSRAMHTLQPGQELTVSRPRDHFPLATGRHRAILFAAGIGITPMLSMARHLAARGYPFVLHYFGRERATMPFAESLGAEFGDRVVIHAGRGRDAIPIVLAELLQGRPSKACIYSCGPDAFMAAVEQAAHDAGWPHGSVHREHFAAPASNGEHAPFDVVLGRSGQRLTVGGGETLLAALAGAGLAPRSSCEQGTCGECALTVRAGAIDHRDCFLSEADRARGDVMLACVSRACEGELVLDC